MRLSSANQTVCSWAMTLYILLHWREENKLRSIFTHRENFLNTWELLFFFFFFLQWLIWPHNAFLCSAVVEEKCMNPQILEETYQIKNNLYLQWLILLPRLYSIITVNKWILVIMEISRVLSQTLREFFEDGL